MIVTIVVLLAVCAALGWLLLEQRYRLLDTQDVLAAERRLHRNRKKRQERELLSSCRETGRISARFVHVCDQARLWKHRALAAGWRPEDGDAVRVELTTGEPTDE